MRSLLTKYLRFSEEELGDGHGEGAKPLLLVLDAGGMQGSDVRARAMALVREARTAGHPKRPVHAIVIHVSDETRVDEGDRGGEDEEDEDEEVVILPGGGWTIAKLLEYGEAVMERPRLADRESRGPVDMLPLVRDDASDDSDDAADEPRSISG